jgi:hypothetical protein
MIRRCARLWIALAISLGVSTSAAFAQINYAPLPAPTEPALRLAPLRNWLRTHEERNEETDEMIETDRPDFTASDKVVPKGWAQLESGYQFSYKRNDERVQNQYSAPQFNLRLGLADWVESRTLWSGFQTTAERNLITGNRSLDTNLFNLQTGFKWKISDERGLIPQSALITTLILPTSSTDHRGEDKVAPQIDYIYAWQLAERLRLCASTGAVFAEYSLTKHTEIYQSVVLEQQWVPKFSTYWECYVTQNDSFLRQVSGNNMDGGFTFRPWKNVQFDWRAGFPVGSSEQNFFTNVGFSARY